jgi:hypothetical protein
VNAYEEKKQRRIERLRARAERLNTQANAAVERASKMAEVIPLGQPILVGHHSEGRDRRYRARIHSTFEKGFALAKEAQEALGRAHSAESNDAISSDDPDALSKLQAKVAEEEALRERVLEANRRLRAGESPEDIDAFLGWPPGRLAIVLSLGNRSISTANIGANIRRLKERIALLEKRASAPPKEGETIGEVRIEEKDNRVRIFFPGKPSEDLRRRLKQNGFRWSPSAFAWQRQPSAWAWDLARGFARELESTGATP